LRFLFLFIGAMAVVVACNNSPSISSPPASPIPSASPTPAWAHLLRDPALGYSLRYPDGWIELHNFDYTGSHFLASRAGIESIRDLTGADFFLFADLYDHDPTLGCGPPINPITTAPVTLDGVAGAVYTRRGVQANDFAVQDILAERNGRCIHLQLTGVRQ
jgi:hypothetical protein